MSVENPPSIARRIHRSVTTDVAIRDGPIADDGTIEFATTRPKNGDGAEGKHIAIAITADDERLTGVVDAEEILELAMDIRQNGE